MKGIATLIGVGVSAKSAYDFYSEQRKAGDSMGEAAVIAITGVYIKKGAPDDTNDIDKVAMRLLRVYGPAVGGVIVSKGASRFGVNRALPKGVNL